jgi:hypothetical protein
MAYGSLDSSESRGDRTRHGHVEELVGIYDAGSSSISSLRDRCRARPLAGSAASSGFLRTSRMPAPRTPYDSASPRWAGHQEEPRATGHRQPSARQREVCDHSTNAQVLRLRRQARATNRTICCGLVARSVLATLRQEADGSITMTRAVAVAVATTASSESVSEASRKARSPSR